MRERTYIVRAERGAKMGGVLQDEARAALEVGVALPLLLEDGYRPAVGPGLDCLVIPISAFDEPHPDRRATCHRPIAQLEQVWLGVAQIALKHYADIGPIAEFGLAQDALKDLQRQRLLLVRLHIDIDKRTELLRRAKQVSQPP